MAYAFINFLSTRRPWVYSCDVLCIPLAVPLLCLPLRACAFTGGVRHHLWRDWRQHEPRAVGFAARAATRAARWHTTVRASPQLMPPRALQRHPPFALVGSQAHAPRTHIPHSAHADSPSPRVRLPSCRARSPLTSKRKRATSSPPRRALSVSTRHSSRRRFARSSRRTPACRSSTWRRSRRCRRPRPRSPHARPSSRRRPQAASAGERPTREAKRRTRRREEWTHDETARLGTLCRVLAEGEPYRRRRCRDWCSHRRMRTRRGRGQPRWTLARGHPIGRCERDGRSVGRDARCRSRINSAI